MLTCSNCKGSGKEIDYTDSAFGTTQVIEVECYKCDGVGRVEVEVKFFVKGDESAKLYTEQFPTYAEYEVWLKGFGERVDIFKVEN